MPKGKAIKSAKQFRLMQAIKHGAKMDVGGPSKEIASKLINETSHARKSRFAKKGK